MVYALWMLVVVYGGCRVRRGRGLVVVHALATGGVCVRVVVVCCAFVVSWSLWPFVAVCVRGRRCLWSLFVVVVGGRRRSLCGRCVGRRVS